MNTKAQRDDKQQKNIRKTTQQVSGAIKPNIRNMQVQCQRFLSVGIYIIPGERHRDRAQTVEERRQKGNGMQEQYINKFNECEGN